MKSFAMLFATAAVILPSSAFAQSTGTVEVETEIVVTGTRANNGVEGIVIPDTPKAQGVLTQEIISTQTPGQSIFNTINLLPGVSFQNNDPYGSAGGTLSIRGFDSSRISATWDGMPFNDTGNYAIYSNQQLDPELIGRVNVNLGTTDVDSPTASAAGGTVNYSTLVPGEDIGALLSASYGDFDFHRVFGMIETGNLTSFGTRAFISAATASNDQPFNDYGVVRKQQFNARIYQPLGNGGDFISLAGHYNENRNNFFGSVPLRSDLSPAPLGFPATRKDRFYSVARCTVAPATPGVQDLSNTCGSTFDERYNPSNTGNIRFNSRFSITDQLIFTADAFYQYVLANGGGTVNANEAALANGLTGYGAAPNAGADLNGDGDMLDRVRVLAPSNTNTNRYIAIANLIYEINDDHRVRVAYTFDHGRHRQTGETSLLQANGRPTLFFGRSNPLLDANGEPLQKRDRLSYAILHQVSAEYRGRFMDDRLQVNIGLRAPFFRRELNQNCFTTSAGGFVFCTSEDIAAVQAANPGYTPPRSETVNYNRLLPNVGFVFSLTPDLSLFANYAKGLSVPSTDNLYNALYYTGDQFVTPRPETTDSVDLGVRYTNRIVQAQLATWYTRFQNRIAQSFDPELNQSVFRNLGEVTKWGIDGSIAVRPIPQLSLYAFGSYLNSEIQNDLEVATSVLYPTGIAPTGGNSESGSPRLTYGGRIELEFGPVQLGAQVKRTGRRFIYDTHDPVRLSASNTTVVYDAAAPAYTLVDLDARFSLETFGLERTYFQLNVSNLFDELYVGGFGGGLNQTGSPPFVQMGSPRAVSGTLVIGF